ncbi:MAG: hypothetical protein ACMXX9_02740 [Candidatus Woesearchaeota archaeon]
MSLLIAGIDSLDYKGKERLDKLLQIVSPNNVIINGTLAEFRDVFSLYSRLERSLKNSLGKEIKNNKKFSKLYEFNKISSYVATSIVDHILNSNNKIMFTNAPNDYNNASCLIKDKYYFDSDINNIVGVANTMLDKLNAHKNNLRYGQINSVVLNKKPKIKINLSPKDLYLIKTTISNTHNSFDSTLYLVDQVALFEDENNKLINSLANFNPHKLSLEDLDSY